MLEIRDTWGVTKKAMPGIIPESWLEWGLRVEAEQAPSPPEADMLAAHNAPNANSRKAQQKLFKPVRQGRHAAHKAP